MTNSDGNAAGSARLAAGRRDPGSVLAVFFATDLGVVLHPLAAATGRLLALLGRLELFVVFAFGIVVVVVVVVGTGSGGRRGMFLLVVFFLGLAGLVRIALLLILLGALERVLGGSRCRVGRRVGRRHRRRGLLGRVGRRLGRGRLRRGSRETDRVVGGRAHADPAVLRIDDVFRREHPHVGVVDAVTVQHDAPGVVVGLVPDLHVFRGTDGQRVVVVPDLEIGRIGVVDSKELGELEGVDVFWRERER
mmetsp:Transcript_5092/g.10689  ORF Transcript_5092/g.10689 Transcript_5092/m.10689 type:complete len:249 (+) Transcript_5092:249-995(+)